MSGLPSSFDSKEPSVDELPFLEKIKFHCKQQPLVPLGAVLTTGAVILAAENVRTGNKKKAQTWFRWRVGLQAATLVALVTGSFIYGASLKEQKSEEEKMREKAKMRERLWIQELERRDQETQYRKKRAELARQKMQENEAAVSRLQKELKDLEIQIKGDN